jgi:L-cystine uptake protein TcyP (sodium:dicarboxylate symporter family)
MSSSSTSNRSTFQKWTQPECDKLDKLAKRSTMLNSVGVFFAIVSIILIIIALVYTYMDAGADLEKATKNSQIAGGLIIATLFTVVITALVGIWQIVVNKEMAKCVQTKSGQAAGPTM